MQVVKRLVFFLQEPRILSCVLFMTLPACRLELVISSDFLDKVFLDPPGVHCSLGGEEQLSGFDVNRNGELDDFDGADGGDGDVIEVFGHKCRILFCESSDKKY